MRKSASGCFLKVQSQRQLPRPLNLNLRADGYRGWLRNQYKNEYGSIQKHVLFLARAADTKQTVPVHCQARTKLALSCVSSWLASTVHPPNPRPASHPAGLCLSLLCSCSGMLWPNHCLSRWTISFSSSSATNPIVKSSRFSMPRNQSAELLAFDEAPGTSRPGDLKKFDYL